MFYETFKTKKWIKKTDFQVHGAQLKHHGIWTLHCLLICKARMTPPKVFSINIYLNNLMVHNLWITPLPLCIMKPISRSILNCKFVGAPWPYARLGLWGPAYLHKIKTSHGLKITNCMKTCTGRNGPFLGAKTLLWKIINNVISNTNQKGVSRDRRWNENYLSAIICHLHSENWFRHICQTCHQDIWKLFAYPYGQTLTKYWNQLF